MRVREGRAHICETHEHEGRENERDAATRPCTIGATPKGALHELRELEERV